MRLDFLYPALIALLSIPPSLAAKTPKNAILLSSVKSLTLRANAKTSHRRVSAIPQLTCKGPACKYHTVDVMRCVNQGADYNAEDIQWTCTANIPDDFKLGGTDVICEGYASRDDEYVLKGSCGVEYRLVLTDKGEEKYGGGWFGGGKGGNGHQDGEGSVVGKALFGLLFVGVAAWILYSMYLAYQQGDVRREPRRPGGGWGGGWGGGGPGGGDPWDPPPPYPGKRSGGAQEGWRPGFWSGAMGGAAAGYMAGNRGQRQPDPPQRGGSWFGGGNSGMGSPSRSGSSSSSSARHESTGFGSTSRR